MRIKMPRVLLIYTGGTIGMDASIPSLPRSALTTPDLKPDALRRKLEERVPELKKLAKCDVQVVLNRDSAHLGPEEWRLMADAIQSKWKNYDGVVLLHGTDTMAYTASALSFLLRPCLKPVVITGSQRPLSSLRTDARRNLISAVEIAAHGPRDAVSQVSVFFDDQLFQGNRVRKRSASEFAAFFSPQAQPLAVVGTEIEYDETHSRKRPKKPSPMKPVFSDRVALMHVTPGFPSRVVSEKLLPELKGLVLVAFSSGTAPTHDRDFLSLLKSARKRGVPVIVSTESESEGIAAGAHPSRYAAGKPLLDEGAYWAGAMTPECAYVKSCWILAQKDGARRFAALWKQDFAGEGTE